MLDYTKYINESYRFILNYEIKDENIIIHYAKEEDLVVPYTKDAETFILIMMQDQIIAFSNIFSNISKKINNHNKDFMKYLGSIVLAYSLLDKQVIALILSVILFTIGPIQKKSYAKMKVILEDYEKNKFFIDNEELFREGNVSINDIDKYTKEELINILYSLEDKKTLKRD